MVTVQNLLYKMSRPMSKAKEHHTDIPKSVLSILKMLITKLKPLSKIDPDVLQLFTHVVLYGTYI